MQPSDDGFPEAPAPAPGRPYLPPPDISVLPPSGPYPVSRGAPERRLTRLDHYNRRAELLAAERLTETGTVKLYFRVVDGEPFVFLPGFFVGIQAECAGIGWCRSPYCIVSPPRTDNTFELLVRLVPEGPLSCYLSDLAVGDVISFRGPAGRSMVPKDETTDLVFLATGVGVGPFLSLSEHLLGQVFARSIRLYWGLRLLEDVCLVDELDDAARRHADLKYEITLTQPPDGWTGSVGRVTEIVPPHLTTLGNKRFFLVGNGAMIEEMYTALSDLGVDQRRIYCESYFNTKYQPLPGEVAAIRERFVASDLFSPAAHQKAGGFIPARARRSGGESDRI